ncbi:DedA family protein [Saccharibacillus alkalitolerans]|uniref:DedA family protein n=1 Tax=Saccharibacillus alkalitolerans TaxID=2705290 RepID=A0ABX0FA12_9BACL|nr:DedA family protein [Saccharibacillus alkalitolerans]NGZ77783.1 DedA family protein [Saccharibacillus alkalitolerans]
MDAALNFLSDYGYMAVYTLLTLGIVGLPVPDEVLMTSVGYLTSIGTMKLPYALLFSFAGALSGMMISYAIGRQAGRPLLNRYGKWIGLKPSRIARVEGWMSKYGPVSIMFGYFIPGFRHVTCYLCGIGRMSLRKYTLFASIGALLWCTIFIMIGRVLGHASH